MRITHLWLQDFRNYATAELAPSAGLTVIRGDNGVGKTNLLEGVAYLATLSSFRGVPNEALVRAGCERGFVRGDIDSDGRTVLVEAELTPSGRGRVAVNRQPLRRSRDLLGALRVTVFSPDDLTLVKGGPAERRRYLDDLLVALHPKHAALIADVERVLRQRNTLLRQAGGTLRPDIATTLEVWDDQLARAGEALGEARAELVEELGPEVASAYARLVTTPVPVMLRYEAPWRAEGLRAALGAVQRDELRRGVTLVGPHRDDLVMALRELPARTQASQGEQRSLALALRLAGHELVARRTGGPPVLLLDDVFSELDPARSEALVAHLPPGQALLTTAGVLPPAVQPDVAVEVADGRVGPL